MKPPFTYFGGKTTLADRIVDLLPEHRHYVEPFAGSLAVLLAKPRSDHETVNDIDNHLMTFWRVLRDRPNDLIRAADLTPHSRSEYATAYEPDDDELEQARRVWICLSQGRAGSLRRTGWRFYRSHGNSGTSMPDYLSAYVERMPACARRLHGVSLECRPALDVIADYGQVDDMLLYCDPPYLGTTRTTSQYRVEMASDDEHRALAAALHDCGATVVLSGYHSPLYDALYADWHRVEMTAFTGQAGIAGRRTEVLWSNRPLGQPSLFADGIPRSFWEATP